MIAAAVVLGLLGALAIAGCGTSSTDAPMTSLSAHAKSTATATGAPTFTTSAATRFWRGYVAMQYNGVVSSGDGRGCANSRQRVLSCTAYVRNAKNSLDSGTDVIGTVDGAGGALIGSAHKATGAQIQAWFANYGGAQ